MKLLQLPLLSARASHNLGSSYCRPFGSSWCGRVVPKTSLQGTTPTCMECIQMDQQRSQYTLRLRLKRKRSTCGEKQFCASSDACMILKADCMRQVPAAHTSRQNVDLTMACVHQPRFGSSQCSECKLMRRRGVQLYFSNVAVSLRWQIYGNRRTAMPQLMWTLRSVASDHGPNVWQY